jgi:hypothetical protein
VVAVVVEVLVLVAVVEMVVTFSTSLHLLAKHGAEHFPDFIYRPSNTKRQAFLSLLCR